jgi:hypothetical protein
MAPVRRYGSSVKSEDHESRRRVRGRETLREVLVVVASILIAFSLDAWWDGLVERGQLRGQLEAVIAELEAGRGELNDAVRSHRLYGGAAGALHEQLRSLDPDAPAEVPDTLVGSLFSHFTMDVSTSATISFLDAGGQSLVGDAWARRALADWPARMGDAIDDQAQLRAVVQAGYHPYMVSTFSLGSAIVAGSDMIGRGLREGLEVEVPPFRSPPATVTLRATPELLNHLSWRINDEAIRRRQMEILLSEQDSLISNLRGVLGS